MNTVAHEELPSQYVHDAAVAQELVDLANSIDVVKILADPAAQEAIQRLANFGFRSARSLGFWRPRTSMTSAGTSSTSPRPHRLANP